MKLKVLVAAALMCAGSAFAAVDLNPTAVTIGSLTSYGDSGLFFGGETWTFDPLDTASGQYNASVNFSFFQFGGLGSPALTLDGDVITLALNSKGAYVGQFSGLISDQSHTLAFSGIGGGTINVDVTAAPVPEPETYAMMLAGLGAIGFMARRRQAK